MERAVSIGGVHDLRGKTVFTDLFGDDLVFDKKGKRDKKGKAKINVTTKLTEREYEALIEWAEAFGMSKAKFIRHCIIQHLKDLTMLNEP